MPSTAPHSDGCSRLVSLAREGFNRLALSFISLFPLHLFLYSILPSLPSSLSPGSFVLPQGHVPTVQVKLLVKVSPLQKKVFLGAILFKVRLYVAHHQLYVQTSEPVINKVYFCRLTFCFPFFFFNTITGLFIIHPTYNCKLLCIYWKMVDSQRINLHL